jgi:hypothetical protein
MAALYCMMLMALPTVLPPLAASAAVLAVGRLLRWPSAEAPRGWSGALAVGAGYVAGHVAVLSWAPFPPREALHRLFYLALAAALLGLVFERLPRRPGLRGAVFFLLAVAAQAFLLQRLLDSSWGLWGAAAWLTALGLVGLLFWAGLDASAARPGPVLALTVLAALAGSARVLLLGGIASMSLLAVGLLSAVVPVLLWAWWRPGFSPRGAFAVLAFVLPGLWSAGLALSHPPLEIPTGSILLLAAVPAAGLLIGRLPASGLPRWSLAAARVVVPLVLVPLAVLYATPPPGSEAEDEERAAYENWTPSPAPSSGSTGRGAAAPVPPAGKSAADDDPFSQLPDRE